MLSSQALIPLAVLGLTEYDWHLWQGGAIFKEIVCTYKKVEMIFDR